MKTSSKVSLSILSSLALFSVASLSGCGVQTSNESEDSTTQALTPPSNTTRTTSCNLGNETAAPTQFNGRNISYFDSAQINYGSSQWWNHNQPWMSKDILNSNLLGHGGYAGSSPDFKTASGVNARVVVVDIRKVNGKLVYHYFSNETANSPLENWSSTKSLAMLSAAHVLKQKHGIPMVSKVSTNGQASGVSGWVGDFVNDVALTSNNRTAGWFKSIVTAQGSQNFVRNWLVGTQDANTSFGGLHGEAPAPKGTYFQPGGTGTFKQVPQAGSMTGISSNTLMPVLMAEFWKRFGVNTSDSRTWMKNVDITSAQLSEAQRNAQLFSATQNFSLSDEDLKVLMYGYVNSTNTGGLLLGATNHNEFVDAFGGKTRLDSLTQGQWRLFGKTGSGFSNSRGRNEAAFGGTICIPANSTRGVLKNGRQLAFFINIQNTGSAGAPRLDVLRNISRKFIPELTTSTNLWK